MKSIDGIKIVCVDGLNRGARRAIAAAGGANGETSRTSVICRAHLSYRAPLIDSLLNDWHRWRLAKGADHTVGFIGNG